jgi:tRNA (cytidine/uridine-2'-O-)-methyltransferase
MRVALFEPDIPQNAGTILRLAACLGVGVDLIEPMGFVLTDAKFRRAGLDYWAQAAMTRHASFAAFEAARRGGGGRLVLFTTRADTPYTDFAFAPSDTLLFGRESSGVTGGGARCGRCPAPYSARGRDALAQRRRGRRDGARRGLAPDRRIPENRSRVRAR